ncbi:hypothetical protein ACQP1G_20825 [Nocardia sp. CA-107356]|uniref:hypothetical protein n=1 Tax=Nocardia sp. CA-107356 TaxID=3239972 RepID=UPI003D926161
MTCFFQGGVLGDQSLDAVFGKVAFEIADSAKKFADRRSLLGDLPVGGGEGFFGVERPLVPAGLDLR